jgi:signal transduction histidine kinase
MATVSRDWPAALPSRWELAAETIAVKIRWFGLLVGYLLVLAGSAPGQRGVLAAILALGAVYALLDTWFSYHGRIFLDRYPLSVSGMEALFIGLLCYFHDGLDSPFRYYYFLSLICCALRHTARLTYLTCGLHMASFTVLYLALPADRLADDSGLPAWSAWVLMLVFLGWVTWAASALAQLLKGIGDHLSELNAALRQHQAELERRIAERSRQLQEAQAHVLHQEKMAAFGLLAAGIAHEVGNPLTSISTLVQLLQRRDCDAYTRERLALVSGQLQRIRTTLRELADFGRPARTDRGRCALADIVAEALGIAKYYKGTSRRAVRVDVPADLPPLMGVHDQLVQVVLNLVLNAVDATGKGGQIELTAAPSGRDVVLTVADDGHGIADAHAARLFQPYFTTKKHGTGLGLFVTRKLVADHGGRIEFDSVPGRGTTFRVYLPAGPVAAATAEPALAGAGEG